MSKLTRIVRNLVGPGRTSTGRGDAMFVGTEEVNHDANLRLIELMKSKFETWEIVQTGQPLKFEFFIRDSKNNYVGHCSISHWYNVDSKHIPMIGYSDWNTEEDVHQFNRELGCLESYKKIT